MKIISPKFHAVIDYIMVMFLLISSDLFDLSDSATLLTYILGGVHFLLTILTRFSGGIFKIIPIKLHGIIEFVVSIVLVILAFTVFKGNIIDEIYFACLGLLILIVFVLTDYKNTTKTII
ncbi:hypothetical protein [Pedobacter sp.]|uniref:hypothetical protein n=1 Tax=Pedobacter sp. TaxID=1411316 RepID=UPI003BABE69C